MAKKNVQDATLKNIRLLKSRVSKLEVRVRRLEKIRHIRIIRDTK
jgi:hypothetical protein